MFNPCAVGVRDPRLLQAATKMLQLDKKLNFVAIFELNIS